MTKTYVLPKDKWLELENHLVLAMVIAEKAEEYDTSTLEAGTTMGALLFRGNTYAIKPEDE